WRQCALGFNAAKDACSTPNGMSGTLRGWTMEPNEAIERFMLQLDAQITAANKLNIPEIKLLLNMARLDLQMRLHGISDHELKSLSSMLEHALADHESGTQKVARRKNSNKVSLEP